MMSPISDTDHPSLDKNIHAHAERLAFWHEDEFILMTLKM